MDYLFIFFLLACGAFLLYKRFSGNKMIETDEFYQQREVTISYKDGTIKIGKFVYPVNKVTGISTVTTYGKYSNNYVVKIELDDMRKPVQNIPVIGSENSANEFNQRICVALRKAGGPSFT